jgi:predicted nucleotidyltransferase
MHAIIVPVSHGEAADKLTILEIKLLKLSDAEQRANVQKEHKLLNVALFGAIARSAEFDALFAKLRAINETLWDIEDDIRRHEARHDFGESFIKLARAVYHNNDERAAIKRAINALFGSELREEKSYG